MIKFKRIGHRLLAYVASVIIVGIIALTLTYALRQRDVMQHEVESSLTKVTESVAEGLAALMATRHAGEVPEFAARLKKIPNVIDYRILRLDGTEAFIDNSSVERVDEKLGEFEFQGRKNDPAQQQVLAATDPSLLKVKQTQALVFVYRTLPGGERQVTALNPIRSAAACHQCHDANESLRGVIMLTTSLKDIDRDAAQTWTRSIFIIVAALASIVGLIYWVAQQTVVSQIVDFSQAMKTAAAGDMSVRLPATRTDELGHMARSFNQMNKNLLKIYDDLERERNKLNTVIQGANSGIVVTNADQYVVLVNKAAEQILGKKKKVIIHAGFLKLFDDPAWMESHLAQSVDDSVTVVRDWRNKVLSVQISTLCDESGVSIGSAALIRDITEEKRLENRLKLESVTDALTGLHNRRHFDEILTTEFLRWRRYKQPVSVAMLDIDHFKKFNDTHGHDCGDRVLASLGELLNACKQSPILIPCRYGGEEMVVIMPGIAEDQALSIADSIRRKVEQLVIDGLTVTVSIGVAGCPGHPVDSAEALLKLADDALYRAKENGRNRVQGAQRS